MPADPESKGGSEATVFVAKADLVSTDANRRGAYGSWAELVDACDACTDEPNSRPHRVTRRVSVEMLAEERARLHRLPELAYTAAFGETRRVSWSATIRVGGVTHSVPHTLAEEVVWARADGDELVVTVDAGRGATEVARPSALHPRSSAHRRRPLPALPGRCALGRQPRATDEGEAAFLAFGVGPGCG